MHLDTAGLYFRAFYGVPGTVRAPNGEPINAVRGLLDMIARLVTEFEPTEIVACWDDDWRPQWRVDLIPTYKTHRLVAEQSSSMAADAYPALEAVPDFLSAQIPIIRDVLGALGIPIVGAARHEADDVMGTLASASHSDAAVDIACLRGDASDGLPGVAGVGEKTAATLLAAYNNLEGITRAAADPASSRAAAVRAKIVAVSAYLTVAPTVVNVVRDRDLPDFDARIRSETPDQTAALERLSLEWGLASSLTRARAALTARARP